MDVNSWDMVCRSSDMATSPKAFEINSDDALVVNFGGEAVMDIITKEKAGAHILGPCVVYMADAKAMGKSLKWFKVYEYAGDKDAWCSEKVASGTVLQVPMKADLKSGDYIVRAEIIGLNMADKKSSEGYSMGAQFFPSCGLITLTNVSGNTKLPTITSSIPGIYNSSDPSLLLKKGIKGTFAIDYKPPGPAEYAPPKGGHTSNAEGPTKLYPQS
ncbi:hypothetical protein GGF44_001477 [Coemansia sp. RSA 1694]|nr:hypothetical protein GGF44_001477 [Coemansia sp. RSA 1694]